MFFADSSYRASEWLVEYVRFGREADRMESGSLGRVFCRGAGFGGSNARANGPQSLRIATRRPDHLPAPIPGKTPRSSKPDLTGN